MRSTKIVKQHWIITHLVYIVEEMSIEGSQLVLKMKSEMKLPSTKCI